MSLLNLCRCTPSVNLAEGTSASIDDFIDDAIVYAAGGTQENATSIALTDDCSSPMRRATFSLNEKCIEQLATISDVTGYNRSRLIRHWIRVYYRDSEQNHKKIHQTLNYPCEQVE